MEMVVGLFALAGEAFAGTAAAGAGAGAAAATTTGLAGAAGYTATALTVLQGVATAGAVLTSLASGTAAKGQAQLAEAQADLEAQEKSMRIRRDYLVRRGAARVAFAASGIDIASGSAAAVEDALADQADFETALTLNSGRIKASQYSSQGDAAMTAATGKAVSAGLDYGISIARRG